MRRALLVSVASLMLVSIAAAQTGTADLGNAGMSESGGQSAVYQAAVACSAAMRYEALQTGRVTDQTAASRMAELAMSSGEGLGMDAQAIQEQLSSLTQTYAEAAAENLERHRRMVAQCAMLARSGSGD